MFHSKDGPQTPAEKTEQGRLSESEIERFAARILGIRLSDQRCSILQQKIQSRIRHFNLPDVSTYLRQVESGKLGDERHKLIDQLLVNTTSFFREPHHFQHLRRHVHAIPQTERTKPVLIWSAGCSSGQEAYSIAMTLLGARRTNIDNRFLVTGSDASLRSIKKARTGIYKRDEISMMPDRIIRSMFRNSRPGTDEYQIIPRVREVVSFQHENLKTLMESASIEPCYDIIFCRNTLIYFEPGFRTSILNFFGKVLVEDGLLFIGHSEDLSGSNLGSFERVDRSTYKKIRRE